MSELSTISSSVLRGLHDSVASANLDPLDIGRTCGVSDTVWGDDMQDVPLGRFVHILEHVAAKSGDPTFGWKAGKTFDLRFLGELGDTMLAAPTLGTALTTFTQYLRLVQSTTELSLNVEGDRPTICYRILDPSVWPRGQDAEFTLSIVHSLLQDRLGDDWSPDTLAFEHGPSACGKAIDGPLSRHCCFGQHVNLIAMPVSVLDRPMKLTDRQKWAQRSRRLELALIARQRARPVSAKVESAVLRSFGHAVLTQQRIAQAIGLSNRSLHRLLKCEGASYSRILMDCRMGLSKHMLLHSDMTLSDIAFELGYSDQSSFSRAFKRHVGQSPQDFRNQALQSGEPPLELL